VSASSYAHSSHAIVLCPACGGSEPAEIGPPDEAPEIVCAECGETWPAAAPWTERRTDLVHQTRVQVESNIVEAGRRPLVTYSDGGDRAWAAKAAGDAWPEPPRQRRLPMIAGAVASVFFLAAFFGAREAAVRAVPDLAGLYAAIGLPVHLDPVTIEKVAADRTPTASGDRVVISGVIRNVSGAEASVPALAAILYDSARVPARAESFDPPAQTIPPGKSAPFRLTLDGAPPQATEVAVRIRRPGEKLPQPPAAPTATQ
jgi:hypothetical protein